MKALCLLLFIAANEATRLPIEGVGHTNQMDSQDIIRRDSPAPLEKEEGHARVERMIVRGKRDAQINHRIERNTGKVSQMDPVDGVPLIPQASPMQAPFIGRKKREVEPINHRIERDTEKVSQTEPVDGTLLVEQEPITHRIKRTGKGRKRRATIETPVAEPVVAVPAVRVNPGVEPSGEPFKESIGGMGHRQKRQATPSDVGLGSSLKGKRDTEAVRQMSSNGEMNGARSPRDFAEKKGGMGQRVKRQLMLTPSDIGLGASLKGKRDTEAVRIVETISPNGERGGFTEREKRGWFLNANSFRRGSRDIDRRMELRDSRLPERHGREAAPAKKTEDKLEITEVRRQERTIIPSAIASPVNAPHTPYQPAVKGKREAESLSEDNTEKMVLHREDRSTEGILPVGAGLGRKKREAEVKHTELKAKTTEVRPKRTLAPDADQVTSSSSTQTEKVVSLPEADPLAVSKTSLHAEKTFDRADRSISAEDLGLGRGQYAPVGLAAATPYGGAYGAGLAPAVIGKK